MASSSGPQPASRGAGRQPPPYLEFCFSVLVFRPWVSMIGGQCLLLLQVVRTTCSSKNKCASLDQQSASKPVSVLSLIWTKFPKFYDYIYSIYNYIVLVSRYCLATQATSPSQVTFTCFVVFLSG